MKTYRADCKARCEYIFPVWLRARAQRLHLCDPKDGRCEGICHLNSPHDGEKHLCRLHNKVHKKIRGRGKGKKK